MRGVIVTLRVLQFHPILYPLLPCSEIYFLLVSLLAVPVVVNVGIVKTNQSFDPLACTQQITRPRRPLFGRERFPLDGKIDLSYLKEMAI